MRRPHELPQTNTSRRPLHRRAALGSGEEGRQTPAPDAWGVHRETSRTASGGLLAACEVTGHYDLKAIDAWMDGRAGIKDNGGEMTDAEVNRIFAAAMEQIG